jgi:hypothetical protein
VDCIAFCTPFFNWSTTIAASFSAKESSSIGGEEDSSSTNPESGYANVPGFLLRRP